MRYALEVIPDGGRTRVHVGESMVPLPVRGTAELTAGRVALRNETGGSVARWRVLVDPHGVARMVP